MKEEVIELKIKKYNSWKYEKGFLVKIFELKNFKEVLKLVNKVGEIAELIEHHPDLNIYSYKFLKVSCMSHNINGISEKDFDLISKIDEIKL